jgi:DNA modification methylase
MGDNEMNKYLNKITCGDSYKLIKELPDKSVDLIVTDPPYLIENTKAGGGVILQSLYKV